MARLVVKSFTLVLPPVPHRRRGPRDASLRQAVHEILIGGYLSAGQRCTCTDRVLVQAGIAAKFIDALAQAARRLPFGHPDDAAVFAGPLATYGARDKVVAATARAYSLRRFDERAGKVVVHFPRVGYKLEKAH